MPIRNDVNRTQLPKTTSKTSKTVATQTTVAATKTAKKTQRVFDEFQLIQELRRVEEWDLVWRIQEKQPMTKKVQKLVAALRSGECTADGIDAWRRAQR